MEFEYDLVLMSLVIFVPTAFALMLMLCGCTLLTQSSPKLARVVYFGPGNVSPGDNYAAPGLLLRSVQ